MLVDECARNDLRIACGVRSAFLKDDANFYPERRMLRQT
jgi:hypothetical protein